ncbi:MAG: type II toxin-antitoxin system PemK/MazF family toxin [Actinomycetaceae bacterium]|nr:type II toxin-antitoxin system PemK/MazF family toxin [Actinomycetaceae bacterium]
MHLFNTLGRVVRRAGARVGKSLTPKINTRVDVPTFHSIARRTPFSGWLPGPDDPAVEYDVDQYGLPDFEYHPRRDNIPDPGEIVWTWVPFEENDGRGKDRPVLVLADLDDHIIFAQTSSKDHSKNAAWEARSGRYWFDIGTGAWDAKRRESEVRIDRLLITHISQVRREGAQLDRKIYDAVVQAIKQHFSST